MKKSIKIVSNGSPLGTDVSTADGVPINGITKIEILPIEHGKLVCARITFIGVELDMQLNAVDAKQAAEQEVLLNLDVIIAKAIEREVTQAMSKAIDRLNRTGSLR
jgi:hypothetical protein